MHQHASEHIGLRQCDQADKCGEDQAMFKSEAEKIRFFPDQPSCRAGDGDGLRRNHFARHASAGVGGH